MSEKIGERAESIYRGREVGQLRRVGEDGFPRLRGSSEGTHGVGWCEYAVMAGVEISWNVLAETWGDSTLEKVSHAPGTVSPAKSSVSAGSMFCHSYAWVV